MSFDWTEYIRFAQVLVGSDDREVTYRVSTSRAYYGAFNTCRIYIGGVEGRTDVHKLVIDRLKESENRKEVSVGNHLDNLREKRTHADYNGFDPPSKPDTEKNVEIAFRILHLIDELRREQ